MWGGVVGFGEVDFESGNFAWTEGGDFVIAEFGVFGIRCTLVFEVEGEVLDVEETGIL